MARRRRRFGNENGSEDGMGIGGPRPRLAAMQLAVRGGFPTESHTDRQIQTIIGPYGIEPVGHVGRGARVDPDLDPAVEARRFIPDESEVERWSHPFRSTEQLRHVRVNAYSNFEGGFEKDLRRDVHGLSTKSSKKILRPARPRTWSGKTVSAGRAQ
jgi:hypothetical protein